MIRFLYFIFLFPMKYAMRIYFRKIRLVNSPKEFFGRTIYVSNHPASFMDPLVVAALNRPIVFFMVRSDVFTPVMKPIAWASHMIPIYRQHDGEDTKKKNEEVFLKCAKILNFGRNLLIFGEGFTDDVFIRRLKPVKKGAVRIGFSTLEQNNWKKKIYIAAIGINYSEPNLMRSDCLLSTSGKICLNDYRKEYEANPNKVITDLTKEIEDLMREQITHVQHVEDAPFHEAVQQITRLGMHSSSSNRKIPLKIRWRNSQKLAAFFNSNTDRIHSEFAPLRDRIKAYKELLAAKNIKDLDVIDYIKRGEKSRSIDFLKMLILSPFALLGFIHCWPVYAYSKNFAEKTFKRKVFYGSVKLLLGLIAMTLINLPFVFLFYIFICSNWWLAILYYLLIGIYFLAMLLFKNSLESWKRKGNIDMQVLSKLKEMRVQLEQEIANSDLNILK